MKKDKELPTNQEIEETIRSNPPNKIESWITLKIVIFGIWLLELIPYQFLGYKEKDLLRVAWKLHDEFKLVLK